MKFSLPEHRRHPNKPSPNYSECSRDRSLVLLLKPQNTTTSLLFTTQSALEFCPIHCPNGRLGQYLGFGGIAFALKLPELLNRNLAGFMAKLGQTSCFPNGPQIWCPIGQ